MNAGMTLAAILSLILALAGAGDVELAKKTRAQVTQQQFEQAVRDKTVTADELQTINSLK